MVVSSSSSSSPKVDYMHVAKMAAASHRAAVEAGAHAYLSQARVGGGMVPTSPVIMGIDAATGQPKFYSPNFQGAYGPGRGKLSAAMLLTEYTCYRCNVVGYGCSGIRHTAQ